MKTKALVIRERIVQEKDVANTWWSLPPQTILHLDNGQRCLLLYSGQPGGPAGPDVRDAVLRLLPDRDSPVSGQGTIDQPSGATGSEGREGRSETGEELAGDVEFHVHVSDWFAHGHQDDARYNRVILHVVHYLDSSTPARRQDGSAVLTCSLLDLPDLPRHDSTLPILPAPQTFSVWPCQRTPLAPVNLTSTLLFAGLRRFHEKSAGFTQALAGTQVPPGADWSQYDACLVPALAEGLGYGRDRELFRAAGLRLLGLPAPFPEPLGRAPQPAPLDASRLRLLRTLIARWHTTGAWTLLRQILTADQQSRASISALRAVFHPLSQSRSDILIINIVLPFCAFVAALEAIPALSTRAQQIYLAYPGLPSNRITRLMSAQLLLPSEPTQACLQQGLHDIYQHTCRMKDCQNCAILEKERVR